MEKRITSYAIIFAFILITTAGKHQSFEMTETISRDLVGTTSASMSVVSGTGISGSIVAFTTYTITVTAKDSAGNNIGHGGNQFVVEIYNKCTVDSNLNCNAVAGARQTLSAPIKGRMADNGDGTYSFNYSVVLDGAVTVVVKLDVKGVAYCKFYNNYSFTDPPYITTTQSQPRVENHDVPPYLIPGQLEYWTGIMYGKIKPSTTATYTFRAYQDDCSKIRFNGVQYIDHPVGCCICQDYFTVSLDQNTYYDYYINYNNNVGGYTFILYWSTPTLLEIEIPAANYVDPYLVASSPYQITASCPTGYYGTVASSPTQCATICGDGIKAGIEACDDGNNIDNDGCQADCTLITPGFACATGNILVAQTCVKCTTAFYPNSCYW